MTRRMRQKEEQGFLRGWLPPLSVCDFNHLQQPSVMYVYVYICMYDCVLFF
ncbi:hypothetical protein Hanom_Chr09g00777041 [Helianthus anomalus]